MLPVIVFIQCSGLKIQGSPPHVRRREAPPVTWQASPLSWQLRKNRQRDALDQAKARFDSHQRASWASLDIAPRSRGKAQQDTGTDGDLQQDSISGGMQRLQQDRNKPQQDSVVGGGQRGPQQDRSEPQHASGGVSDLKGHQDIGQYSRRLTEDVQMRDMLRRLQKLEELEHAKMVGWPRDRQVYLPIQISPQD